MRYSMNQKLELKYQDVPYVCEIKQEQLITPPWSQPLLETFPTEWEMGVMSI